MQVLDNNSLEQDIKALIVTTMSLEDVAADDIDTEAPLFNEGLGWIRSTRSSWGWPCRSAMA